MDENKNCWIDYKSITLEEYDQLRELLYKLQARIKEGKGRIEGAIDLDKSLYILHKSLFRNKDRIDFEDEKVWCCKCDCFTSTDNAISIGELGNGEVVCLECSKLMNEKEIKYCIFINQCGLTQEPDENKIKSWCLNFSEVTKRHSVCGVYENIINIAHKQLIKEGYAK